MLEEEGKEAPTRTFVENVAPVAAQLWASGLQSRISSLQ